MKKSILTGLIFILAITGLKAQISSYAGGYLGTTLGKVRSDESTYKPGLAGGFTFVYWDNPTYFIKTGLGYSYRASKLMRVPTMFSDQGYTPEEINYTQFDVIIPMQAFIPVWEKGHNTILITGGLELMYSTHAKYSSESRGDITIKGTELDDHLKMGVLLGPVFQRKIQRDFFFNVYPSFHIDVQAPEPFKSFGLTFEMFYGVF